jgi:hypothetical protein
MPAQNILNAEGFLSVSSQLAALAPGMLAVPGGAANACIAAPMDAPQPAAEFNTLMKNWTVELLQIAGHVRGLSKATATLGQRLKGDDAQAAADLPG